MGGQEHQFCRFFCIYLEPKSSASRVFTVEAEDFMLNEENKSKYNQDPSLFSACKYFSSTFHISTFST